MTLFKCQVKLSFVPPSSPLNESGSTDPAGQALVVLGAVIGALNEDWAWCSEAVTPPEHLVLAIRAAPGPVLRGLLVEVVEEVSRRRCRG